MNIDRIRNYIEMNVGNLFFFKYRGVRNQTDEFIGKITETYKSIFIVRVNDSTKRVKSFSYNDVLTNNLKMKEIILKK